MYSADTKNHANMAAAHSTPTTLAVATLRRRNSPSGISGDSTRASIVRNSAISAAAAPNRVNDCVEVQPASLPLTTAYTASISEAVTLSAPATSSRAPAAAGGAAGISRRHSA
ncbi:Uncharacterised protein [Achromobacter aegrifaciens]|uniref:Uncharacterized protein n=1 Tax=Achromobacter aegrifaciens TaxID=1287736 RepID=A0AAD2IZD1_ACHAE|nr:Uncharacterised protein [Achromobacter aegrifaciens]